MKAKPEQRAAAIAMWLDPENTDSKAAIGRKVGASQQSVARWIKKLDETGETKEKRSRTKLPPEERLRLDEEAAAVLRLKMAGVSIEAISDQFKISVRTVYSRINRAVDNARPTVDADAYIAVQLAEMQAARIKLNRAISLWRPGSPAPADAVPFVSDKTGLQAIHQILKLHRSEDHILKLAERSTPAMLAKLIIDAGLEDELGAIEQFANEGQT